MSDSSPIRAGLFKCHHRGCQRVFERRHLKQFRRHVETHDPATKIYACPWPGCNHSTRQNSNLKTHMKKHTDTKDLLCPHPNCTYATGDPAAFVRHRKRVHEYKPRRFVKHVRYDVSGSGSLYASPPPPRAKREVDLNWYTYPFEGSFAGVQAKPLYPAAEALQPALDVDSLFPMVDSGYDSNWNATAESPAPWSWSSWESRSASMNWSMPLDQSFMSGSSAMPYPSPPGVSHTEQSIEQRALDMTINGMDPSPASEFPSPTNSYFPTQPSGTHVSDFAYLNGF